MDAHHLELQVGDLSFETCAWGPPDGEGVLLLHGFPESSWAWRYVLPALAAAGFRAVAPDLRGYSPGARPAQAEAYTIEQLVADAVGMADVLGWERFHVVGHDWGGVVAWHLAGAHPDRINTLNAVATPHPRAFQAAKDGPPVDGDDQASKAAYMSLFRAAGAEELFLAEGGAAFASGLEASGLDPDSVAYYVERSSTPEAMVGMLNWYRGADPADADKVGPITVPTLYVYPNADSVFGPTAAAATAAHVAGPYRYEVLDGVSHWAPEEASDDLIPLLLEHLLDHSGSGDPGPVGATDNLTG